MKMVVGLRNPGADYAGTRHNVGAEVVEALVGRTDSTMSRAPGRANAMAAVDGVGVERTIFLLPNTFMNVSGGPVKALLGYFKVPPGEMLVVHDDIDLPFGRLRLQVGGGSGGHNGIRSVESALGTPEFSRLKVGVGRPPGNQDPADYVLRPFTKEQRTEVDLLVEDAADVVERWLTDPDRAQELAANRGRDA